MDFAILFKTPSLRIVYEIEEKYYFCYITKVNAKMKNPIVSVLLLYVGVKTHLFR